MKTFLLICLSHIVLVAPGLAQNPGDEHLKNFDLVWHTVDETFFDPGFGGIDWQAMRERYRPQISAARDIDEFSRITNQMLFELGVSHLLVASEKMLKIYMPMLFAQGTVGVAVRWMQDKAVVSRVEADSAGQAAGVTPGYVLTRIDGRGVEDIAGAAQAIPPYNERNRNGGISNYLVGHLDGPPGTSVAITYLDENARARETVLVRRSRGPEHVISDAMPPVFIEFEARRLDGAIGYIRFNHFVEPVDQAFLDALEELRDTRGLIFDLRGNPGGYFRVLDTIIEQLITAPTPLYRFRLRDNTIERTLRPVDHPYRKPLAVLIDTTSTSASEHFAACLQASGRALIVGEQSPGYLLGARWTKLPNGLSFMHAFLQPIISGGRVIEGEGVKPDITIELDRQALLSGVDKQLQAAVAAILNTGEH